MVSNSMPTNNIDQNQNQTNPNIMHFIEITKTDAQTANIFLTRCNGDMQNAIADFYANGDKIQPNKSNSILGHTVKPDYEMIKANPQLCLIKANLYVNGQWATYHFNMLLTNSLMDVVVMFSKVDKNLGKKNITAIKLCDNRTVFPNNLIQNKFEQYMKVLDSHQTKLLNPVNR